MNRQVLILLALLAAGCGAFKDYQSVQSGPRAKVTIAKNTPHATLDVVIFESDIECGFHFVGRVMLKDQNLSRTIVMPAKRAYFRVSANQHGYNSPGLQDVSFLLQDNHQYSIEYLWKGSTTTFWEGTKGSFEINYLEYLSDKVSRPVETDHFSVCKREKETART